MNDSDNSINIITFRHITKRCYNNEKSHNGIIRGLITKAYENENKYYDYDLYDKADDHEYDKKEDVYFKYLDPIYGENLKNPEDIVIYKPYINILIQYPIYEFGSSDLEQKCKGKLYKFIPKNEEYFTRSEILKLLINKYS